jgi:hypothetical protein
MVRCGSLFSQLLDLIPRPVFAELVRRHRSDYGAKGVTTWAQCVAMLFCHLAQAKSLREISNGLRCCLGKLIHLGVSHPPNKSSLAYANAHRPWQLYEDLFFQLLGLCRAMRPRTKKFRFKNKLLSLDASVIELCLRLFPWAEFNRKKGAVKLHLLLDHDGYFPAFAHLTLGNVHEVRIARELCLAPGSIVAMDKGYTDYSLFGQWTRDGVWFVTRLKDNAVCQVIKSRPVPPGGPILADEEIQLCSDYAAPKCPYLLRRVVVWDQTKQTRIVLLTNHLWFAAATIAAIYKERWQIEIFFKTLKQNLKIKTFVGTSQNALYLQIWTALIAMLLLKYLQFRSRRAWSLSNLIALLRLNLFTYRDLWQWLDQPFETPPLTLENDQLFLPLPIWDSRHTSPG